MEDSDSSLVSLSLTHVRYNPDDWISYGSAWLALVPQGLCVVYATLIWATREVEVALMFAGQLACEALNFVLKRWIREERPKQMFGKGYGMPSSHAQFVAFFAVSLSLFLLFRHVPSHANSYAASTMVERMLLSAVACLCASAVAASRAYLYYHTPKQVLVGVAAGTLFAVSWFLFTMFLRRFGWVDWALETWMSRKLRIRDLVTTEDLMDAGWERWQARRKSRRSVPNGSAKKTR